MITTEKLFEMSGLSGTFDSTIPQERYDEIADALGENPWGMFVWWYPSRDDREYDTCGMFGKALLVSRLFALAVDRRKLIESDEKYRLVTHLMGGVDKDIVLADEKECMEQEKAYYG
jgi:hypothetical protein